MVGKKLKWYLIGIACLLCLMVIGSFTFWQVREHRSAPLVPANISQKVNFIIYYPGSSWQTKTSLMTNPDLVLTLNATQADQQFTVTEQATPEVFNDVPQYYSTLLARLNQYGSFGTLNGTVYLTLPKELNGDQQAVLNNNGTLVFAHANHKLTNDKWQRFFNDLQPLKP